MSTDAGIEEHWISEAVLPRPRRAPKLPALQVPHAPTCSRRNAALAAHAQSRDSARHPGDGLSARQDGRNVVDQQARTLTQPRTKGGLAGPNFHQRPWLLGALSEPAKTQANPPLFRVGWDKRGQPRSNLKSGPSAKEERWFPLGGGPRYFIATDGSTVTRRRLRPAARPGPARPPRPAASRAPRSTGASVLQPARRARSARADSA